jgi:benzoate membrane transport protein
VFVGFSSSFAVVLEGLTKVGATRAEAASGLMSLSVAMGVCGILLSLRHRMPISIAWSTPGAAFLASSEAVHGGFPAAVGAFGIAAVLIVITGLWKPLGRCVAAIPRPLANAMLAGVLLPLCLAPARAVVTDPALGIAIVATWGVVSSIRKLFAVPAAVVVAAVLIATTSHVTASVVWTRPVLVQPAFSVPALIGIALPLYVITMASQNIPGIAVLHANGYEPELGPLLRWTGAFSLLSAPFGGHQVNLAAITAALCAGDEAGSDRTKRYRAAVVAGGAYILLGLGAGTAVAFARSSPPALIGAVAGLALLGALGNSLAGAVADAGGREAAVVTLAVTVSGVAFFGISGAFWGLVAGGALYAAQHWRPRLPGRPVPRPSGTPASPDQATTGQAMADQTMADQAGAPATGATAGPAPVTDPPSRQ